MSKIIFEDKSLEYTLKRSKRKTIGITISSLGDVVVTSPYRVKIDVIEKVVKSKEVWIYKKLKEMEQRNKSIVTHKFVDGEQFKYLGQIYILKILNSSDTKINVSIEDKYIEVKINKQLNDSFKSELIKISLIKWYREEARKIFKERTEYYGNILGVFPQKIFIKEQKTLWGSCSYKNNINYNWKVIMAPLDIVDYLVVHEMCHIIHKNHSKDFWNLVESIISDYKERRKWLREKGQTLEIRK